MREHTPTTEEVLRNYQDGATTCGCCSYGDAEDAQKFNRWLRAELARAWDEGAEACAAAPLLQEFGPNPYRKATGDE